VRCLCTPHRRTLFGGGYNQGFCVYFAKGCGDWVFAGVNEVAPVDVKIALSLANTGARPSGTCRTGSVYYSQNRDGSEV